ncbi:MAG: hypothetical protein IKB28_08255 [Clostridia bacterium]|nr:hypothetical protein [Clostridia bacterium]
MIYDKNRQTPELDRELFKNPTAQYRGTPFWAWNCDLQKDELLRQIDVFKQMGLGGFHMHCRDGMSTTYLSDDFMDLVKACTDHAEKNEMLAWLYDEDKWPSGFAGGYVTKDPAFRQRFLCFTSNPGYITCDSSVLIAKFDVVLGEDKCLKSYRKVKDGDQIEGTLWTVWREIAGNSPWYNNQSYVDTLNKAAIEKFIEVTHERYFETVGDRFGSTVPAIFTDEPQFMRKGTLAFADSKQDVHLPWTDDLEDTFKAAYGDSLVDHLPELLWDLPGGEISLTRYHYHDHVSERFAKAFADTCGDWCDAHNIALTGHMMEEPTLHSQTAAIGDCMRSYRAFGIPGIDMLCAKFEFTTAKQCQSSVHQYGRPGMMSELYGVTGWDFDFRGHKLHGDWQAALGVTVRVQHLSWVSMKGTAKRDYPASISYQSPWYGEYSYVEDHFGRVNTALTRGTPLVKVGVVHPVESYWLHWGPNEQTQLVRDKLDGNFQNVTSWLLRGNIDFDFICESTLPDLCPEGGNPLQVGKMAYDVVIVPECETLRSTTLARLEAFCAAGGKLVFMGDAPKYEDAKPSVRGKQLFDQAEQIAFSRGALLEALYDDRTVEIRNFNGAYTDNLIHQIRRDTNGVWLFISHCTEPYNKDVARSQGIHVYIKGKYKAQLWDTVTGEIKPVRYSNRTGGKTHVIMKLHDYDSALLYLEDTDEDSGYEPAPEAAPTPISIVRMNVGYGAWAEQGASTDPVACVPATVSYTLSEPNVLLLDTARYALDGEELAGPEEILRIDAAVRRRLGFPAGKAQPWVIENKPAEHTVTLEYTIHSEIDYEQPYLALEEADLAKIEWNGHPVCAKPEGYYVDLSIKKVALPPLCKGENTLRVTIPFAERSNCEAMYLLGMFGVKVAGRQLTVTALPETLGFSDLTYQGLPFYGGAVSYHIPVACEQDWEAIIRVPHYTAAVNTVEVDGEKRAVIAYPPYVADLGKLSAGKHTISVTSYISRRNCFGDVHNADETFFWQGPSAWVTSGSEWTYEYRLRRTGVLSTPEILKK